MAKKLNIKGVIVDYDDNRETWNGYPVHPTPLERLEMEKATKRRYREERRKEREAKQAEKAAQERARVAYQASLNVPTNNYEPPTLSDAEIRGSAGIMSLVIGGGLVFACILAVLFLK